MISTSVHGPVTRIRMSSPGSRLAGLDVSAYLIRGTLVDTGFPRVWPELREVVASIRPRGAIVTHWHEDHAGNAPNLAAAGVPMTIHPDTAAMLREAPAIRMYRRGTWGRPRPLAAFTPYEDPSLRTIHTPGHSDDHHVVWDPQEGILFSGDLWLGVRSRIMHEHEDPQRIVASLRTVAALGPARMFDAHRGEVLDATAAIEEKIAWLTETIGTIERRIAEGWSDRAIVRDVLGGEELAAFVSFGEYARLNFVRAVRRTLDKGPGPRDQGPGED